MKYITIVAKANIIIASHRAGLASCIVRFAVFPISIPTKTGAKVAPVEPNTPPICIN